jgi:hypothetical protein
MAEQAEALLQRAADAAVSGDTRGAVMLLFHAAGAFDKLAGGMTDEEAAQGACAAAVCAAACVLFTVRRRRRPKQGLPFPC